MVVEAAAGAIILLIGLFCASVRQPSPEVSAVAPELRPSSIAPGGVPSPPEPAPPLGTAPPTNPQQTNPQWPINPQWPTTSPDTPARATEERQDAVAAYTQALMWIVTRDHRHAAKAIDIMDAWSGTIASQTGSNARLQAGWSAAVWARAAEIIRHTGAGWASSRVNRFETMLRNVYLPRVTASAGPTNGNWDLTMTDAAIGISVFLDDRASFQRAVDRWRNRVAAHIYLTTDGALPRPPPNAGMDTRGELVRYWHGQYPFVDGLTQETCRSFHYAGWGLAASAHIAETARHQGLDPLRGDARTKSLSSELSPSAAEFPLRIQPTQSCQKTSSEYRFTVCVAL